MIDIWLNELALPALFFGFLIGLFIGLASYYSFRRTTREERMRWEQDRFAHHYVLGVIALLIGILSPLMAGTGIRRILTDIGDIRRRFSKEASGRKRRGQSFLQR